MVVAVCCFDNQVYSYFLADCCVAVDVAVEEVDPEACDPEALLADTPLVHHTPWACSWTRHIVIALPWDKSGKWDNCTGTPDDAGIGEVVLHRECKLDTQGGRFDHALQEQYHVVLVLALHPVRWGLVSNCIGS